MRRDRVRWIAAVAMFIVVTSSHEILAADVDDEPADLTRAQLFKIFILDKERARGMRGRKPRRVFVFGRDDNDGKTYGIDVSHHKGKINWPSVARAKVKFTYTKATEGATFKDKRLRANMVGPRENGIPTGVYHWLSANTSVTAQLKNFFRTYDTVREDDDLPPVLDLEWDYSRKTKKDRWVGKSPDEIVSKALRWLQGVEKKYRVKPIIYTNRNWWRARIGKRGARLQKYKIWMSRYKDFDDTAPALPPGFGWALWQFTDRGRVPGIVGAVDVNFVNPNDDFLSPGDGPADNEEPKPTPPPDFEQPAVDRPNDAVISDGDAKPDPAITQRLRQRIAELATANRRICKAIQERGETCTSLLNVSDLGIELADHENDSASPPDPATTLAAITKQIDQLIRLQDRLLKQPPRKPGAATSKPHRVSSKRKRVRSKRSSRRKVRRTYPLLY